MEKTKKAECRRANSIVKKLNLQCFDYNTKLDSMYISPKFLI